MIFGLAPPPAPPETSDTRRGGTRHDAKVRKDRAMPPDVVRRLDKVLRTAEAKVGRGRRMSRGRQTAAHDLTSMPVDGEGDLTETIQEGRRQDKIRLASKTSIVTPRVKPHPRTREPPELPQAMSIPGHKTDGRGGIPSKGPETEHPRPHNGTPEPTNRTREARQETRGPHSRDEGVRSTPHMKGLTEHAERKQKGDPKYAPEGEPAADPHFHDLLRSL